MVRVIPAHRVCFHLHILRRWRIRNSSIILWDIDLLLNFIFRGSRAIFIEPIKPHIRLFSARLSGLLVFGIKLLNTRLALEEMRLI